MGGQGHATLRRLERKPPTPRQRRIRHARRGSQAHACRPCASTGKRRSCMERGGAAGAPVSTSCSASTPLAPSSAARAGSCSSQRPIRSTSALPRRRNEWSSAASARQSAARGRGSVRGVGPTGTIGGQQHKWLPISQLTGIHFDLPQAWSCRARPAERCRHAGMRYAPGSACQVRSTRLSALTLGAAARQHQVSVAVGVEAEHGHRPWGFQGLVPARMVVQSKVTLQPQEHRAGWTGGGDGSG